MRCSWKPVPGQSHGLGRGSVWGWIWLRAWGFLLSREVSERQESQGTGGCRLCRPRSGEVPSPVFPPLGTTIPCSPMGCFRCRGMLLISTGLFPLCDDSPVLPDRESPRSNPSRARGDALGRSLGAAGAGLRPPGFWLEFSLTSFDYRALRAQH